MRNFAGTEHALRSCISGCKSEFAGCDFILRLVGYKQPQCVIVFKNHSKSSCSSVYFSVLCFLTMLLFIIHNILQGSQITNILPSGTITPYLTFIRMQKTERERESEQMYNSRKQMTTNLYKKCRCAPPPQI